MIDQLFKKTIRKRKRVKRLKNKLAKNKFYFTADTQAAIEEYQLSDNSFEKNKIYTTRILPAFKKLVENLICIYKFVGLHDTHIELKNDCITFLFETIPKFNAQQARDDETKAFSYFNVVAKNWLIVKTKKRQTALHKLISLDVIDDLGRDGYTTITSQRGVDKTQNIVANPIDVHIELERIAGIKSMLLEIKERITNESEIACIDSVICVFDNIDDLPFLNKRAVFTYLREISGLNPKQLTIAISAIRRHYNDIKLSDL